MHRVASVISKVLSSLSKKPSVGELPPILATEKSSSILTKTPLKAPKSKPIEEKKDGLDDDLDLARTVAMGAKTLGDMAEAASSGYDSP
jgi:hypothetical protein